MQSSIKFEKSSRLPFLVAVWVAEKELQAESMIELS
jgi:hypothetical protein